MGNPPRSGAGAVRRECEEVISETEAILAELVADREGRGRTSSPAPRRDATATRIDRPRSPRQRNLPRQRRSVSATDSSTSTVNSTPPFDQSLLSFTISPSFFHPSPESKRMTVIPFTDRSPPVARILLCRQQPAPLYELLAAADDPSLEISSAEIDTADVSRRRSKRSEPAAVRRLPGRRHLGRFRRGRPLAADSVDPPIDAGGATLGNRRGTRRHRLRAGRSRLARFAARRRASSCCDRPCKRPSCSPRTDRSSGSCRCGS